MTSIPASLGYSPSCNFPSSSPKSQAKKLDLFCLGDSCFPKYQAGGILSLSVLTYPCSAAQTHALKFTCFCCQTRAPNLVFRHNITQETSYTKTSRTAPGCVQPLPRPPDSVADIMQLKVDVRTGPLTVVSSK